MYVGQIPQVLSVEGIEKKLEGIPANIEAEEAKQDIKAAADGLGLIGKRYQRMVNDRRPYLDEARRLSRAVMPELYPPEDCSDPVNLPAANQSLVARGVQNLAYKLGSLICPSNAKFFQRRVLPSLAASLQEQRNQMSENPAMELDQVQTAMNQKLMKRDEVIREHIKTTPDSENYYQGLVHQIVAGQVVFAKLTSDTSKLYTLEEHCCEFDSSGEAVDIIMQDYIHPSKFHPDDLKDLFGSSDLEDFERAEVNAVPVYTRQVRRFDHYEIQVEVAGKRFRKMEGKEDLEAPPFIALPFLLHPRQKYGLGWVTHNKGDIIQFENTSLAINLLCKAACKIVGIVPPDMKVTQAELSKAGASWIFGSPNPVQMVLADVSKNLTAILAFYNLNREALQAAFLLNEAVRRDAERVTGIEINAILQGLRELLGGLFMSQARRFQYPYATRMEKLLEREGKIPTLEAGVTQLILTAGVETLEAYEALKAQDELVARAAQFGPEGLGRIGVSETLQRAANYLTVDSDGVVLSDEQFQTKQGVQQLIQVATQMGPQGPQLAATLLMQVMSNPMQAMKGMQSGLKMAEAGGLIAPDQSQEQTQPQG